MHLKRNEMLKIWPLKRKGTKYLVRPLHNLKTGIPLLIILRDILKLGKTRKELKNILNEKRIKVNQKVVKNDKFPLGILDVLSLDNKNFRIIIKNKKFSLKEIEEKEAEEKVVEIIGKKILRGKKVQINLMDGRNYLIKDDLKVGDSVIINLKENKITNTARFKENSKVLFVSGKHIGEEGIIKKIDNERKLATIKLKDEEVSTHFKTVMVIK